CLLLAQHEHGVGHCRRIERIVPPLLGDSEDGAKVREVIANRRRAWIWKASNRADRASECHDVGAANIAALHRSDGVPPDRCKTGSLGLADLTTILFYISTDCVAERPCRVGGGPEGVRIVEFRLALANPCLCGLMVVKRPGFTSGLASTVPGYLT